MILKYFKVDQFYLSTMTTLFIFFKQGKNRSSLDVLLHLGRVTFKFNDKILYWFVINSMIIIFLVIICINQTARQGHTKYKMERLKFKHPQRNTQPCRI